MKLSWKLFLTLCVFPIIIACNQKDLNPKSDKLKLLALEDIQKWNFEMTRKDIGKIVDDSAILHATMHSAAFKAKEGGAYNVDFVPTEGKPFPYKLYSVYYLPNFPEEEPHELVMKDTSSSPLPKVPMEKR